MQKKVISFIVFILLMIMVPLGSISSHIIESTFFKKSTKIPIILSTIGLFLGNILYYISIKVEPFILLFIGRFLMFPLIQTTP